MACQKQLEAAQKFLRGIRSLTPCVEVRDQQAAGVTRSFEKAQGFTAAQAAAVLALVEPDLWATSHVEAWQELVALKTKPVESETTRGVTQDFALLPYYLSDDLAAAIGETDSDTEKLLFRLCHHAAQLTLRNATEATKATLVVMAHWASCKRGAYSPRQQHELFLRHKPTVTRILSSQLETKLLSELPLRWEDLDPIVKQRVFPTGKPSERSAMANEICEYVRKMPLRKDNRLLQAGVSAPAASSTSFPSGGFGVDDICKVVEACHKSMHAPLERAASTQSNLSVPSTQGCPQILAICDALPAPEKSETPVEDTRGPGTMSVEEQLAALQDEMKGEDLREDREQRGGNMKKPAAAPKSVSAPKAKGRPRAKPKAKSASTKTRKPLLKRPAAVGVTTGHASEGRRGTAASQRTSTGSASSGALSRAERRKNVVARVPRKLRLQFARGVSSHEACIAKHGEGGNDQGGKKTSTQMVRMAPKQDRREESEYSYMTDEDEEGEEVDPPEEAGSEVRRTPVREERSVFLRETASVPAVPAGAPKAKSAAARDEPRSACPVSPASSSDRGPRARRSERSPRGRGREDRGRSRSCRRRRRAPRAERSRSRAGPPAEPFPRMPEMPPPPPPRSKGKGKTRKQVCPHCWQKVGTAGGSAGLSQHQWWNETCLAWQIYGQHGEGCSSWEEAVERARALKDDRRRDAVEEYGMEDVVPARSMSHRRAEEARRHDEPEPESVPRERKDEKKKKKKDKKRRPRPSPSPDVRSGPKGPRRPPSSDDEDKDTGAAKRRKAADEVWICVPRAALIGR
eukprot:s612_g18.t1